MELTTGRRWTLIGLGVLAVAFPAVSTNVASATSDQPKVRSSCAARDPTPSHETRRPKVTRTFNPLRKFIVPSRSCFESILRSSWHLYSRTGLPFDRRHSNSEFSRSFFALRGLLTTL